MTEKDKNYKADVVVAPCPNKNDAFLCYGMTAAVYLFASILLGAIQGAVTYGSTVWWICLAASSVAIGLSAVIYCKAKRKQLWAFVAADVAPNPIHTIVGCVFILGLVCFMSPVTNWIYDFMQWLGFKRPSVNLPEQIVPLLLTATLLPAFCEELVFRGVVGNGLVCGYKNKIKAVLLSGALFALFHANPAQTLHQFFVGCFLTLLFLRGGSLWTCVIVHFVNNLAVVIAEFTLPDVFFTSWLTCLVGGIVAACALAFYLIKVKPSKNAIAPDMREEVSANGTAVGVCIATVAVFVLLWVMSL